MTFYNTRASIAHVDEDQLYLFRHIDNKIIINYYSSDGEGKENIIIKDALGEFDLLINEDNEVYLVYQDVDNGLRIITIDKDIINEVTLTKGEMPKVFELNMIQTSQYISIIYMVLKSSKEGIFEIHHHLLKSGKWTNHVVEEIRVDKLLNPIKVMEGENGILLAYYYGNHICIREFNTDTMEWQESMTLNEKGEKLYIDIIKMKNHLHLVYCQHENGNYIVKYDRYEYGQGFIVLEEEVDISSETNPSNPTLVIEGNKIWIIWNESSTLLSRFSQDDGDSWSPIYLWKKSRTTDILRYKYIVKEKDKNTSLDYGFGTIHPDIQFLGFGPLEDVDEIVPKKKVLRNMLRL